MTADLIRPDRYPLASRYDPDWLLDLDMGPNPLWQLEDLLPSLALAPGQRVLDLGSGRGASAVFLVRERGVEVVACDLWVPVAEASRTFAEAGVRVTAVQADVRDLPFADAEFDAIVSIDAFEYFGTDVHVLPRLLRVLKPGGRIAISTPALRTDPYAGAVPPYVSDVVGWEAAAWHAPDWWRRHWELTGLLDGVRARWQDGGRDDWLRWARAGAARRAQAEDTVVRMLAADTTEQLGFTLLSGVKRG